MKIQFGCGSNILEGWENNDIDVDITKPLPYQDDSADMILAEHVVEHVTGPEAYRFLLECRRIIKPGGTVRICVPVVNRVGREKAVDLILNHGHLVPYTVDSFAAMMVFAFDGKAEPSGSKEIDGHWRVIGREQDELETFRMEGTK